MQREHWEIFEGLVEAEGVGHSPAKAGVEGGKEAAAEQIVVAGDGIEEVGPSLHIL